METIVTLMSDEQFNGLCEHIASHAGINLRARKRVVKQQRTGSKIGKIKVKEVPEWDCDHSLQHAVAWMEARNIEVRPNIERIYDLGGHCDCEVLWNAAGRWEKEKNGKPEWPKFFTDAEWVERIDWKLEQAQEEGE